MTIIESSARFTHIRIRVVVGDLNVLLDIGDDLVQLLLDTFLLNLLAVLLAARLKIAEKASLLFATPAARY